MSKKKKKKTVLGFGQFFKSEKIHGTVPRPKQEKMFACVTTAKTHLDDCSK